MNLQEIVDTVVDCIKLGYDPKTAAKKVVNKAEDRGSSDDKTCNIIYFGWHKNLFSKVNKTLVKLLKVLLTYKFSNG